MLKRALLPASITVLVAMATSPALMLLALLTPLPWNKLSDVGQAYGAISAVASGLALLGVTISLTIQQQQNRTTEEHTVRQRHFDLVKLTLEEPRFLYSWGATPDLGYDPALIGFSNLIVTHWLMLWRIKHIDEAQLRSITRTFFAGQVGRDYWRRNSDSWATSDKATAQFAAIVTAEYEKALASGPPIASPPPLESMSTRPPTRNAERADQHQGAAITAAFLGALVATVAVRTLGKRSSHRRPHSHLTD